MLEPWVATLLSLAVGLLLGGVLAWIVILHDRVFVGRLRGRFDHLDQARNGSIEPGAHPGLVAGTASFYALSAGVVVFAWLSPINLQPWAFGLATVAAAGTTQGLYRAARAGRLAGSVDHTAEAAARVLSSPLTSAVILIVVGALITAIAAVATAADAGGDHDQTVTVPSLVGMTLEEARRELERVGLELGTTTRIEASDFAPGEVIDQSPEPGTSLPPFGVVDVVVATGRDETSEVPIVIGRTLHDAEILLENSGLEVGEVSEESSEEFPAGTVVAQSPEPGVQVTPGSSVDLIVSSGLPGVTVPDVRGLTVGEAEATLASVGLELGTVTTEQTSSPGPGIVISQTPEAGSVIARGEAVGVVVAEEEVIR